MFAVEFGSAECSGSCKGDLDGDDDIDGNDLQKFAVFLEH